MKKLFMPLIDDKVFTSYYDAMHFIKEKGMQEECDVIRVLVSIEQKMYQHNAHAPEAASEDVEWAAMATDEAGDIFLFFEREELVNYLNSVEYASVRELINIETIKPMAETRYYYEKETVA